ncbi:MAG: hypothetical protein IJ859_03165 [Synergistaceae bacterium]|nr:hypothetical protein [Synergistaceae bacterium]
MKNCGIYKRDAAQEWVKGFNAVPTQMIYKLWKTDPEDWHEVTCPGVGNRVYAYDSGSGEIIDVDYKNNYYKIKLDSGGIIWLNSKQIEIEYYDQLPMWDTMWSFGYSLDNYWLDENDGIMQMSQCGFRIFKSEEFGYFFGIDGAGYDFYEEHWIPLYNKRGLKWHDHR